jgi:hypothetical protein
MQEHTLTFNSATRIFINSKEEGMAFNFFKGEKTLIAQLFKSEDFKKGIWKETGIIKSNSYVLVLYFSDKQGFNRFLNSSYYKAFKKAQIDGNDIPIYNFKINFPFKIKKLIKTLRGILYSIYEFEENKQLEFEVVAY